MTDSDEFSTFLEFLGDVLDDLSYLTDGDSAELCALMSEACIDMHNSYTQGEGIRVNKWRDRIADAADSLR